MNPAPLMPHPIADLIPAMSDEEYQALKADIAVHGQREPVVLYEGKILDGRHRYRACDELGLQPKTRPWDGQGFATDFVRSENIHRRHLTASQRAAIAVEAEAMRQAEREAREREHKGKGDDGSGGRGRKKNPEQRIAQGFRKPQSRDEAAESYGTNRQYIQDAKTIRNTAPELLKQVKQGKLTLPQAKQQVRRDKKQAEIAARAVSQPGQIDSDWQIHHGDCVAWLPQLTEQTRLIFADPPYNIGIDYGQGPQADRLGDAEYLNWVEKWLAACRDVLTPDGSLWVLIGDEYAAEYAVALKQLGLSIRSWIKWFESFGVNCSRNFNRCSRHLFYCVRDPKRFVFNEEAVTRPSDRQTKYADKRANPSGKLWDNAWGMNPPIPRLTGTCHERIPEFPTQLPLALVEPIVLCASEPGDLVVDPFSGSGTTGVAVIRHSRRYLGIERSQRFVELSTLRLQGVARE